VTSPGRRWIVALALLFGSVASDGRAASIYPIYRFAEGSYSGMVNHFTAPGGYTEVGFSLHAPQSLPDVCAMFFGSGTNCSGAEFLAFSVSLDYPSDASFGYFSLDIEPGPYNYRVIPETGAEAQGFVGCSAPICFFANGSFTGGETSPLFILQYGTPSLSTLPGSSAIFSFTIGWPDGTGGRLETLVPLQYYAQVPEPSPFVLVAAAAALQIARRPRRAARRKPASL
jgi:hypothetical protein